MQEKKITSMLPTNTTKNYYDLLKQWIRHYSPPTYIIQIFAYKENSLPN